MIGGSKMEEDLLEQKEKIEMQELFVKEYEKINEKNSIVISEPTILAKHNLSLTAQRILRVVASLIKEDDKPNKIYRFGTRDFCNVFGIKTDKLHKVMRSAMEELRQTFILPVGKGRVTGFISTGQLYDNEIHIQFDPFLQPYYQNSLNGHYKLINVKTFNYSYTFRFYELFLLKLKDRNEHTFYIDLTDLKAWLKIEDKYKSYADLKRRILTPIINDINGEVREDGQENSCNLRIEFEEVKTGKKISGLNFKVKKVDVNQHIVPEQLLNNLVEKTEIFDELQPDNQHAYLYLKNTLKVHKNSIDRCIKKFGEETFTKIYMYIQRAESSGKINNITRYAAKCLNEGYFDENLSSNTFKNFDKRVKPKMVPEDNVDETKQETVKYQGSNDTFFEDNEDIFVMLMDEDQKHELYEKVKAKAIKEKHIISIFCQKNDMETVLNMPGMIRPFVKLARTILEEEKGNDDAGI